MLCRALRLAGVRPYVLSLGRGKANGSWLYFRASVRREHGIPVVYAPFCHLPVLSELLSLGAPVWSVLRLARSRPKAVVFYNRLPAYVPALFAASLAGFKNVLDLEDGEVLGAGQAGVKRVIGRAVTWVYDRLCRGGALLACSALATMTRARPVHCYYGTAEDSGAAGRLASAQVTVLMSGTLMKDTGADLLLDAIRTIRKQAPVWAQLLRFEVTGMGPSLNDFSALVDPLAVPEVVVHGRTTDAEYRQILSRCDVGLALKPLHGPLADTTFPSKVIEFASAGLLVLTTDISDVREVLGPGGLYLTRNDSQDLVDLLMHVVENRAEAATCAEAGRRTVSQRCSPTLAGRAVAEFIFGSKP